jgi:hypothetical protein
MKGTGARMPDGYTVRVVYDTDIEAYSVPSDGLVCLEDDKGGGDSSVTPGPGDDDSHETRAGGDSSRNSESEGEENTVSSDSGRGDTAVTPSSDIPGQEEIGSAPLDGAAITRNAVSSVLRRGDTAVTPRHIVYREKRSERGAREGIPLSRLQSVEIVPETPESPQDGTGASVTSDSGNITSARATAAEALDSIPLRENETLRSSASSAYEQMLSAIVTAWRKTGEPITERTERALCRVAKECAGEHAPGTVADALRSDVIRAADRGRSWSRQVFLESVLPAYIRRRDDDAQRRRERTGQGGAGIDQAVEYEPGDLVAYNEALQESGGSFADWEPVHPETGARWDPDSMEGKPLWKYTPDRSQ